MDTKALTFPLKDNVKKLKSYKYEVKLFYLHDNISDFRPVTKSMTDFTIQMKYTKLVHPILVIDLVLKREFLVDMQKNIDSLVFKLQIFRYPWTDETNEDLIETLFPEVFVRDLILVPYDMDLQTPPLSSEEGAKDDLTNDMSSNQYPLKLYLFSEELLELTRKFDSVVLKDANMLQALAYLFTVHEFPTRRVIMGKPDNMRTFNQILIPPLKIKGALNYLQKYYGIFKEGYEFFIDFRNIYFISRNIVDKNVRNKMEHAIMTIELVDEATAPDDGVQATTYYDDAENGRYYVRMVDTAQTYTRQDSDRELIGENLKFISRPGENSMDSWVTTDVRTNLNPKVNKRVNKVKSEKVYYNTTSNDYNVTEYVYDLQRSTNTVIINLSDVDLDYVTPNRIYHLKFTNSKKDKEYSGLYQLISLDIKVNTFTSKFNVFSGIMVLSKIQDL